MKPQKNGVVRAFIALELPQEIKQAIADYVAPLRTLDKSISWTKAENVHLTLKFLGDATKAQIENVTTALREICTNFAPIAAEISGAGVFPNEHRPRVLWIGLQENSCKLAELAQRLESEYQHLGFEKEARSFSPHLTIARVKEGKAANVVKALRESPFPARQIFFRECVLMRSELHAKGSIYTTLEKVDFNARL